MLPTLPAPCPCHCNGLTGECLFDRRQIETCNKMIKQLLATSRCSPSFPSNCGHKLFSKFQCWLSRFFFLSVYTVCISAAYSIFICLALWFVDMHENHISHSYFPLLSLYLSFCLFSLTVFFACFW